MGEWWLSVHDNFSVEGEDEGNGNKQGSKSF